MYANSTLTSNLHQFTENGYVSLHCAAYTVQIFHDDVLYEEDNVETLDCKENTLLLLWIYVAKSLTNITYII